MSADTYFYMGSADTAEDTDPCMRHYTLGKDYGEISLRDHLNSKKQIKKLGRLIEQGCFKFTNLTNYHFYVNVPTCTWMRGKTRASALQ